MHDVQRVLTTQHWRGEWRGAALGWRCRLTGEHVGHQARETR